MVVQKELRTEPAPNYKPRCPNIKGVQIAENQKQG